MFNVLKRIAGIHLCWLLAGTCAVGCGVKKGQTQPEEAVPTVRQDPIKAIAVAKVGEVDDAMVGRIKEWVEFNTAMPVRMLEPQAWTGTTLDDAARTVGRLLPAGSLGAVALARPEQDMAPHGIYVPAGRVAVVNVRAMDVADDGERFLRRVERQAMRAVGLLMDMNVCPNPQCALAPYNSLHELDEMGRNFCPPCLVRIQERAEQMGIPLKEENALNLIMRIPAE